MRNLILYLFLFAFLYSAFSQKQYRIGIESSTVFRYPNSASAIGLNLFGQFKKHEIYFGFNQLLLQWAGVELGYKHHFLKEKRRSHFYFEWNNSLNGETSGGGPSYSYFHKNPKGELPDVSYKDWHFDSAVLLGYELFFSSWLSFSASTGIDFSYINNQIYLYSIVPGTANTIGGEWRQKTDRIAFVLPVKLSWRFRILVPPAKKELGQEEEN